MTPLLLYALKVLLCSSLLTGYYYLALRNKVFHQSNRFYLLLTVVLSFVIPLFHFTIFQAQADDSAAIHLLQTINGNSEEFVVIAGGQSTQAFNWQLLASVFYGGVSMVLLVVLVCSVARLLSIVKQHTVQEVEDIHFINTDVPGTPFSFLRYIFWNRSIDIDSPTGKQILKHELVHVREWHTADKLFMQVVLIVAWCNPVFWIIRHELKMIHEFIADNKAVQDRDATELAAMILQAAYPTRFNHLINPFFHQSIKRRLLMLTKIQNPRVNYISRIMFLPLVALIVFLFSIKAEAQAKPEPLAQKMVVVIDAGHGKADGKYTGVRSGSLCEDEITLAIAKQVQALNSDKNLEIVMIRTGEENVDLHQRTELTKAAKADLFISLHVNASEPNVASVTGKDAGFEIYTSWKNTTYAIQNNRLASAITQSLKGLNKSTPTVAQRQKGVWVLDQAPCPSVLLECGYITNADDRAFVTAVENQKAIAQKILEGISSYVNAPDRIVEVPVMKATDIKEVEIRDVVISDNSGEQPAINMKGSDAGRVRDSFKKMLIILDGKQIQGKDLDNTNPSNIKYIKVLRPQEAVAKYGERARYGAMEISTKAVTEQKRVPIKEVVVEGYKTPKEATEQRASLKEVAVTGYPIKATPSSEEVVVMGRTTVKERPEATKPIFTKMEQEPKFNGDWSKFLMHNLDAKVPGSKGAPAGIYKVLVQMLIEKDGTIEDIKPLTNWGFGMEEEVVRTLKLSPKWLPAKQNGREVKAYHDQPITFVISDDDDPVTSLKSGSTLTVAELQALPLSKLIQSTPDYPRINCNISTDLANGDVIVASISNSKSNDYVRNLIAGTLQGKTLYIDNRVAVLKNGSSKKLPSLVYHIK